METVKQAQEMQVEARSTALEAAPAQPAPPQVEIDEDSAVMLANLTVRGVPETNLMLIFGCTAQELAVCRENEYYKQRYAEAMLELERRAMMLDNGWDDIEERALSDLKEQFEVSAVVDPRQLLYMAATANKMARRSLKHHPSAAERARVDQDNAHIDGQNQVVIRLRAKFVTQIDTPAGQAQLLERETTIKSTSADKLLDEMGVADVRRHLTESLGIDLNSLKTGGHLGPDEELARMMGAGVTTSFDLPSDMFARIDTDAEPQQEN